MNSNKKTYSSSYNDMIVRLGEFALQSQGAAWVQNGDTVVLVTLVKEKLGDFPGYFPLSVDYREQFAAAGKIPGGYLKREGKPSEKEVLLGRIIDRCMRPLFDEDYFDRIQMTATVYSLEKDHMPISLAVIGASLSACLAEIPFLGPVGGCEVVRHQGVWKVNPSYDISNSADTKLFVAGTIEGINMVEGISAGVTEGDLIEAFFVGHEEIKRQIVWQNEVIADYRAAHYEPCAFEQSFDVGFWKQEAERFLDKQKIEGMFSAKNNIDRNSYRADLFNNFMNVQEKNVEEKKGVASLIQYAFSAVLKKKVIALMAEKKKRVDGRDFSTVRPVSVVTGLLPRNHGSALFTRGNTQVLVSTTLGGSDDEMRSDGLIDEPDQNFMLHYNFLPCATGEAKNIRAPGRREIGHGNLAANAIRSILPDKKGFPYTIRIVSDVIESDGSSSQATVCGAMMSLMDAGVQVKGIVSGVAMGMIQDDQGEFHFLTDLSGLEDEFGLMDFKVAGTASGITAIQMDIKYKGGLGKEVFSRALSAANAGRAVILDKMKSVLSQPKSDMSPLVPRCCIFYIPKEKIGAVIGSGGKVIRDITEKNGVTINIEDDGEVKIFGGPESKLDDAVLLVKVLSGNGSELVGKQFDGIVKRVVDFGWFIEFLPNIDGLVHISSVSRQDFPEVKRTLNEGDKVTVAVVDYDTATCRTRLKIVNRK